VIQSLNPRLVQRLLALTALALVLGTAALALGRDDRTTSTLPESAPAPGGGWYDALAAPEPSLTALRANLCGFQVTKATQGVAHPVLPCGAQIYVRFEDAEVLTRVIGRGPLTPRSEFAVTPKLAQRIGLAGVQRVTWRFAAAS
jgi:hypothetical protein